MKHIYAVHNGYISEQESELMDIWSAVEILQSHESRERYLYIERVNETEAELDRYVLICPYCYTKTTTYQDTYPVSEADIDRWAELQQCLFFDRTPPRLYLHQRPRKTLAEFSCPSCNRRSLPGYKTDDIIIGYDWPKLYVECAPEDPRLLKLLDKRLEPLGKGPIWISPKRYRERLTLNIRNGHAYYSLLLDEREFTVVDITRGPFPLITVVDRLLDYPQLIQAFVDTFKAVSGNDCCFEAQEMTLQKLVMMNLFQGYPRSFYDAIPWTDDQVLIRSIKTKHLHQSGARRISRAYDSTVVENRHSLVNTLTQSILPQVKTVKKRLFKNPALLFYLKELESIWPLFGDNIGLFCNLLDMRQTVFLLLAMLNQYPTFAKYIELYVSHRGIKAFVKAFADKPNEFLSFALTYQSMNPHLQKTVLEGFMCKDFASEPSLSYLSIPEEIGEGLHDYHIAGYTFSWLRNSADYKQAADVLHNCLSEYRPEPKGAILVIKHGAKIKAAIEVRGKEILQARGPQNTPLESDPEVKEVFDAWMSKYGFQWLEDDDLEVDYYNLE